MAYWAMLRREAREDYHHEVLVWAALAPHQKHPSKPPELPRILRQRADP